MSGAIKINGTSSGSTTITAPASGGDESIELSTVLAAKGDVAGETWTGTHDFSGATVSGITSGLALLNRTAFSSVVSASVDSVFSSSFDNYRVVIPFSHSASGNVALVLRAAASDVTGYDYGSIWTAFSTTVQGTWTAGANDLFQRSSGTSTGWRDYFILDLISPNLAQSTYAVGQYRTGYSQGTLHSGRTASTQFDGIKVYTSAGTITGDILIYGYSEA